MTLGRRNLIAVVMLLIAVVGMSISPTVGAQIVLDVIDLGDNGGGVAVNPNTHRVYVAVKGQINVYDAESHAPLTAIPLPQNYTACYDVAVNTATNRIYAVGFRTYVIDGNTHTVLHHFAKVGKEIAVNPTTNRIYIASLVTYPYTDPHVVHVLDGASNTWLPDINLGSTGSSDYVHLAVNPTANRVYVAFTGDDDLRVLDGTTHAEVTRLHLADIGHVAVNPDTNRIYVRTSYEGAVVLDGATHTQVGTVPKIAGRLRLNWLTNHIYGVAPRSPGYILQIADGATNSVVGYVYLDGDLENYGLHIGLGKVFATHDSYPPTWGKKMTVIQDASPTSPAPTAIPGVIATLDLPEDGEGVAVNSMTNRLYVGVDGGIAVFDATTLAPLPFIDLSQNGYSPPVYDVGVDETLNRIYAVSVGRTYVLNGANGEVLGQLGGGNEIAVNPINGRVYIADESPYRNVPDYLKIYDGVSLAHIRTLNLGTTIYVGNWVHVAVNPTTGYAYCTYSLGDDLRIISPTTDDVVQTIDYASSGTIAVNPATNRVYVWISRGGQSGALILDGNTHAELGMIQGVGGQLETNPQTDRLHGYSGSTLFQVADGTSGELQGRVFLDGRIKHYAVHPGLSRLYATHDSYPAEWAQKVSVIQDAGGPPGPTETPTSTPTNTPTPTPTFTPGPLRLYLPLVWRE